MSGVPQGSVLGPVLFLLHINDCLNGISCDAVMFADDVKIWWTIESPFDVQSLQNDINQLSTWSQRALISFNADKCVILRLHPQQAKGSNPQYRLNGGRLKRVNHRVSDLGVIVDEMLKPNRQCAKAAKNASSIMRAIKASSMLGAAFELGRHEWFALRRLITNSRSSAFTGSFLKLFS